MNKGNRLLRKWHSIRSLHSGNEPVPADVDAATLANEAVRNFDITMITEWKPKRHDALNFPAKHLFDAYSLAIVVI